MSFIITHFCVKCQIIQICFYIFVPKLKPIGKMAVRHSWICTPLLKRCISNQTMSICEDKACMGVHAFNLQKKKS